MTTSRLAGRRAHTVVDSPVGPITLLAVDGTLAGLYMSEQRYPPAPELFGEPGAGLFAAAAGQLAGYFDGTLTSCHAPSPSTTAVSGPPKTHPVSMPTAYSVTSGLSTTLCPKMTRSGPRQWFVQNVCEVGAFEGQ